MNINFSCVFLFITCLCFSQTSTISTKKIDNIVSKYNLEYNDAYSWLEDINSEEVKKWVSEQNLSVENNYSKVKKTVSTIRNIKIYNSSTTGSISRKTGRYYFSLMYVDLKKTPHLFMRKDLNSESEEILNPNKIYPNKNVSIDNISPSLNSSFLAYALRINGSDRLELRFIDLIKNQKIKDTLSNIKFSNICWNKDKGVFYKLNTNKTQFAKDSTFKVFYHALNTLQNDDQLVFDGVNPNNHITFFNTKSKFFLIENNADLRTKKFYYADLDKSPFELINFFEDDTNSFDFINYHNGRVYYSSKKYNWGEVRSFDMNNKEDDKQVIPQFYNQLIVATDFTDEYIICKYKTLDKTFLSIYDYSGTFIKKVEAPTGANISYNNYDATTNEFYFDVDSYTYSRKNFKVNLSDGKAKLLNPNEETVFLSENFEVKRLAFKNRENIDVPITIVQKKNLELNGNNPCLLEAYGGFGIINTPDYDNSLLNFINKGGIYAFVEIRGGGEKGEDWHKKGRGINKINGLNDFIDGSEFLIKEKYTNPQKLAISGASHGGLVVGYALVERPDLYKLALPKVGAFDMLNFHKYTVGVYHLAEFGNPEIEEDYKRIYQYSPLHKIKEGINYPTTIIFTADNDDRVPPFHSYKFAAALQNREAQKNPIFLSTKKDLGHYGGNTYDKRIKEDTQFFDYLIYYLMKSN